MTRKLILILLIAVASAIVGCSTNSFSGSKNEGRITYEVEIINDSINPLTLSMLPSEAEYYFTKDKSALFLSAKGNFFRFGLIAENKNKIVIQELKIMSKKVKAVFNARDVFYYQDHPGFTILETGNTDTIAGLAGEVSIIIFDNINSREFEIVHTNEIRIEDPNWYSLYKELPNVLLQYEYMQFGLKFKMRAKKIEYFDVDKTLFEADIDYRDITPEELVDELKKLADTM